MALSELEESLRRLKRLPYAEHGDPHSPLPVCQGMAEVRPRKTDDFTIAGCAVVLANALLFASEPLQQACVMLGNMELGTNSSILNGYLYMATLLLQSVLDSVAATCQKVQPIDGCGDVYFCSYSFFKSDVVWLSAHQRVIGALKWKGSSFNQLANALKHEQAWVGCVSAPSELGVRDVYDEEGAGFVYSILVPVYKQAKCMVCRLASQLGQSAPRLPDL